MNTSPKTKLRKPKLKHKIAFQKVLNGTPIHKAMREVGYSEVSTHSTAKLTRTQGWKSLVEKYLPDRHLAKRHREFLDAPRIVRTFKKGDLEIETEETDSNAVKALDMAYKLKGAYAAEKSVNLNLGVEDLRKEIQTSLDDFRTQRTGVLHETPPSVQD